MGRTNTDPNAVMAARLVLLKADVGDDGSVRAEAFDGEVEQCAPGMRCFRKEREGGGRVFVVQKVAAQTISAQRYVLCVVYMPAKTRDAAGAFLELADDLGADVVKTWAVSQHADGSLRVPTLDADATAIGTAVKANWPATWRLRLAGDAIGDPPTGPRVIGNLLA